MGAGDAFVGTLAVGLISGLEEEAALRRAVVAGALATTRAGAQPSMPWEHEITEMMAG